ncbi:hypothetical protein FXN63_03905 [Pigmentiphaga aceris]|uniref:Peptidase C51 domain-containing protein n=1 Tax=Pigmentiphaga aceris TaxID=1940612 RepID=A0A5C0ASS3_9BURK|nr:hypothetical protein [Pigmentiphaga aceris]QEI05075.1 hypothetical protein FXN63_03905 [Pigmentiphaga aceris]
MLDNCGVDQRWLPGFKVRWKTGEATAAWPAGSGAHTHCSAFVASMAMQLGIYLLRPPEHGQTLLANAQVAWLLSQSEAPSNWRNLGTDVTQVQAQANQGLLVLAAVENPNPAKPGHIAIVRPGSMAASELAKTGPMLTQAGNRNALSIPLSQGFRGHRGAWVPGGGGSVRFFAHEIDWAQLG